MDDEGGAMTRTITTKAYIAHSVAGDWVLVAVDGDMPGAPVAGGFASEFDAKVGAGRLGLELVDRPET
jgi:predicted nuclease with TOPRIM domain